MIAYLKGTVISWGSDSVVLSVRDVGYQIFVGIRGLAAMRQGPQPMEVLIEEISRDGQSIFFGFLEAESQKWFRWLIQVPGVGGRMALSLLSSFPPEQLSEIILHENVGFLRTADGVGPKLAVRLVHELKDKAKLGPLTYNENRKNAVDALCSLGYSLQEAQSVLDTLFQDPSYRDGKSGDLVRAALQILGKS